MERKPKRIGTCVFKGCGKFVYGAPHHRKLRSQQGSDADENLVDVCYVHHNWIHAHPEKAHKLGLYVMENEPEPTEKLLEVSFREQPQRPSHSDPKTESQMEELLFGQHPYRNE